MAAQDGSDWSEPAALEATLLDATDWSARFVSPRTVGGIGQPAPTVRGAVQLHGAVVRARLHVTDIDGNGHEEQSAPERRTEREPASRRGAGSSTATAWKRRGRGEQHG